MWFFKKTKTLNGKEYTLDIPKPWILEYYNNIATIYNEDGCGAVNITSFICDENISDGELMEEIPEFANQTDTHIVNCGDYQGHYVSIYDNDTYWRKWLLRKGKSVLFITYNSEIQDKGVEDGEVDNLLSLLKKK